MGSINDRSGVNHDDRQRDTRVAQHEIFLLLTAYLEALGYGDVQGILPRELVELPLSGMGDVRLRITVLTVEFAKLHDRYGKKHAILKDAADILGSALQRLDWLDRDARMAVPAAALRPSREAA